MTKASQNKTTKVEKQHPAPTRSDQLRKLLKRKSGVSIKELQEAFGWQPHTARAAISRLRKTGLDIAAVKSENSNIKRYKITRVKAVGTNHAG